MKLFYLQVRHDAKIWVVNLAEVNFFNSRLFVFAPTKMSVD